MKAIIRLLPKGAREVTPSAPRASLACLLHTIDAWRAGDISGKPHPTASSARQSKTMSRFHHLDELPNEAHREFN